MLTWVKSSFEDITMQYKRQMIAFAFWLAIGQSNYAMDFTEIFQPDDESIQEKTVPQQPEFPKECEEKLSRRYLHSLPDRADTILTRRNGCISTLFCYGLATCLVATVDVDTNDRTKKNNTQKKSP